MKKKEIKLLMSLMASGMSSDEVLVSKEDINTLKMILDDRVPGILIKRISISAESKTIYEFEYEIKPEVWFEWMKLKTNQ